MPATLLAGGRICARFQRFGCNTLQHVSSDLDVRVVIKLELVLGLCELQSLDGPGLYPCQGLLHLHACSQA